MERLFDRDERPLGPVSADLAYADLDLPAGVGDRPYLIANMIATVDGKAVFGGPGSTWKLGGEADHRLFRSLRRSCDAVIMGAGVVNTDDPIYPRVADEERAHRVARGLRPEPLWVVVSGHARLEPSSRLFAGGRENVWVVVDERADPGRVAALAERVTVLRLGRDAVDLAELGRTLRARAGVLRLYGIGGPTLNGGLLAAGMLDELFLTVAPHLFGGQQVPGLVEGPAKLRDLKLISVLIDDQTVFLRYRRG